MNQTMRHSSQQFDAVMRNMVIAQGSPKLPQAPAR
jgi:hypothetical protein